jgi:hypothetical protein
MFCKVAELKSAGLKLATRSNSHFPDGGMLTFSTAAADSIYHHGRSVQDKL